MTSLAIQHEPRVAYLSAAANIPATAGGFAVTDVGAVFPRVEVAELLTGDGVRGVDLMLIGAITTTAATFTPNEARQLAGELVERADRAERIQR